MSNEKKKYKKNEITRQIQFSNYDWTFHVHWPTHAFSTELLSRRLVNYTSAFHFSYNTTWFSPVPLRWFCFSMQFVFFFFFFDTSCVITYTSKSKFKTNINILVNISRHKLYIWYLMNIRIAILIPFCCSFFSQFSHRAFVRSPGKISQSQGKLWKSFKWNNTA